MDWLFKWYKTSDLSGLAPAGTTWKVPSGLAPYLASRCGGDVPTAALCKKMSYVKGTLAKGDVATLRCGTFARLELLVVVYKRIAHEAFLCVHTITPPWKQA